MDEFGFNKRKRGGKGEELACEYITQKGYTIIERNYFIGRGEIDIIAEKNDTLVFIEVKYRRNMEFGEPEFAITKRKQAQIKKLASAYFAEKGIAEKDCRIDVIAILHQPGTKPLINHILNAF